MRHRVVVLAAFLWPVVATVTLVRAFAGQTSSVAGATKVSTTKRWVTPRTPDGKPDLQGFWNFSSATPLERPPEFAAREFLSDQNVAAIEQRAAQLRLVDPDGRLLNTPPWWTDFGTRVVNNRRSSLIIDPPDGKVPAMTPEGLKRQADLTTARVAFDGPESLNPWERCITRGVPAVMLPGAQNNNLQLLQTPGYVVIATEMIHEARIVPLDGRTDAPQHLRAWMGHSRGRWEGDTLVVETTNFHEKADFLGAGGQLHLIERFRRIDAGTIDYRFTVEDPTTWTKPWTVAVPLVKTDSLIYEYACHEGNYSMGNMLSMARSAESARAQKQR